MTLYNKDNIQATTAIFNRPLNGQGGFVEFNVDLDKYSILPDPDLPDVINASVIYIGFFEATYRLDRPGIDPVFYDWTGRRKDR